MTITFSDKARDYITKKGGVVCLNVVCQSKGGG